MTDHEKYSLLAELLKQQHDAVGFMTEDQLIDYVELMSMFLKTDDPIHQEASLSTMTLIVKNATCT